MVSVTLMALLDTLLCSWIAWSSHYSPTSSVVSTSLVFTLVAKIVMVIFLL